MQITASLVKELRDRTGAGMMECKRALTEVDGDVEAAVDLMRKKGQAMADKKADRVAAEGRIAVHVSEDLGGGAMVEVNCETDFVAKEDDFQAFVVSVAERAWSDAPADLDALLALPMAGAGSPTVEERRRELIARIGENISVRRFVRLQSDGGRLGSYVHGARIGVLVDITGGDEAVAKNVAMHVAASKPLAVSEADVPADRLAKEKEILLAQVVDSGKPPEIQEKMVSGRLTKYLAEITLLGQPFVKDPDQTVEKYLTAAGATVSGFARFEVGEGIEKKTENFAEEVMSQVRGG